MINLKRILDAYLESAARFPCHVDGLSHALPSLGSLPHPPRGTP